VRPPSRTVGSIGARRRLQRLGRAPQFASLPRDVLRDIAACSVDRIFERGATLFREGDGAAAAYVLDRGVLRMSATTPEGRSVVFGFATPGDTVGLSSLMDGGPRSAEARALTDGRAVAIPYPPLRGHLDRSPIVCAAFARHLASQLRRERRRLASLSTADVAGRIAGMLVELGGSHGRRVPEGTLIDLPLRHEDLAGLVGSTRETVTRALAALAERGFVRRFGERYLVLGAAGLAREPGA
jgi:CRP/FNR family cyclic AMP-dependent transcriptional regulator